MRRIGLPRPRGTPGSTGRSSRLDAPENLALRRQEEPRDHQRIAIDKVVAGLRRARPRQARSWPAAPARPSRAAARRGERRRRRQGPVPGPVDLPAVPDRPRVGRRRPSSPIRPLAVCSDAEVDASGQPTTRRGHLGHRPRASGHHRRRRSCGSGSTDAEADTERDDGGVLDLPVDRRRRPGAAGPQRVRPDHLRRGAPHHRRHARRRGRVGVRAGPRQRLPPGRASGST